MINPIALVVVGVCLVKLNKHTPTPSLIIAEIIGVVFIICVIPLLRYLLNIYLPNITPPTLLQFCNFMLLYYFPGRILRWVRKEKFREVVRSNIITALNIDNITKEDLSKTEEQILPLVLKGYSSSEISRELHRSRIMKKLGAKNFIDLVKKAFKMGYHNFLED